MANESHLRPGQEQVLPEALERDTSLRGHLEISIIPSLTTVKILQVRPWIQVTVVKVVNEENNHLLGKEFAVANFMLEDPTN